MGNPRIVDFSLMQNIADTSMFLEKRFDYNGSLITYVGYNRKPNEDQGATTWFIVKLNYNGNNLIYYELPINGAGFNYSWTNRATYFL